MNGVTGSQLRRWRESKNLSRAQLLALLPSPHCAKSTERIAEIENEPDRVIPGWISRYLGREKVRYVSITCDCDLLSWAERDSAGQETPDSKPILVEDMEESQPPVSVCDIDESSFIAQLINRQGYDCTPEQVSKWLAGETPPVEVSSTLASIRSNIGYLVRAAQAESVVSGMFGTISLGGILKQEPIERSVQSDADIRKALGERELELSNHLRLPRRYEVILEQLSRAVRMDVGEFINLWLERSLETVLSATKIKTKYDDLGIQGDRRKLFKFRISRAMITKGNRPAAVNRSSR